MTAVQDCVPTLCVEAWKRCIFSTSDAAFQHLWAWHSWIFWRRPETSPAVSAATKAGILNHNMLFSLFCVFIVPKPSKVISTFITDFTQYASFLLLKSVRIQQKAIKATSVIYSLWDILTEFNVIFIHWAQWTHRARTWLDLHSFTFFIPLPFILCPHTSSQVEDLTVSNPRHVFRNVSVTVWHCQKQECVPQTRRTRQSNTSTTALTLTINVFTVWHVELL